jgi:hypothetical protein
MIGKQRHKRELGQGMVEFALVLPALLLTLMGIADFGRLFAIYSNMFNAAREGTRYGVVNPLDVEGITWAARSKIDLADPDLADIYVHFDSGPGTPAKSHDAVTVGDRVVVTVDYDVEMMTPFIRAIARQLRVETVAARTISTLGDIGTGDSPPAPPTSTPDGTTTPSPTPTVPSFTTATPTATGTPPSASSTPTPTPGVVPIQIDTPLWDGDMAVTGIAQAGEIIYLRDIQNPALDLSTTVNGDGTFRFDLPTPLVAGHVIAVQGYGSIDYAVVEGTIAPTATPTPTASPMPTATPSTAYIVIEPTCGPQNSNTYITVRGYNWPCNKNLTIEHWSSGALRRTWTISKHDHCASFVENITIDASSAGVHTIKVYAPGQDNDSKDFSVPCQITPTPTPSQPNLVVESITLENDGTISTYDPLTFTVAVRNIGAAAANSLFWVDLYVNPAVEPPSPSDLMSEASVAWAAVSSLAQGETISLTLHYLEGFDTTGNHTAYSLADTWDQVLESDELDNVGGPLAVAVSQEGSPPAPTPTPTPGGTATGAISGSTWLFINGDVVPQGRINIYCYDGDVLIAETLSDQDGNYLLEGVPPGTYTVIGQTFISGVSYSDIVLNVEVNSGQTTPYVTLVLH